MLRHFPYSDTPFQPSEFYSCLVYNWSFSWKWRKVYSIFGCLIHFYCKWHIYIVNIGTSTDMQHSTTCWSWPSFRFVLHHIKSEDTNTNWMEMALISMYFHTHLSAEQIKSCQQTAVSVQHKGNTIKLSLPLLQIWLQWHARPPWQSRLPAC